MKIKDVISGNLHNVRVLTEPTPQWGIGTVMNAKGHVIGPIGREIVECTIHEFARLPAHWYGAFRQSLLDELLEERVRHMMLERGGHG